MLLFFAALESLEPEERDEIGRIYEKTYKKIPLLLSEYMNISYEQQPELIDDLTQDVYLKVIKNKDKFIGQSDRIVMGNLTKIAQSVSVDYLRHNKLIQFCSLDDVVENDEGESIDFNILDDTNILGDIIRDEVVEQISVAIGNLDSPFRELILDRYYSEMPYAEIAKKNDLKVGAIGPLLGRGLERLRKELEDYVENHNG